MTQLDYGQFRSVNKELTDKHKELNKLRRKKRNKRRRETNNCANVQNARSTTNKYCHGSRYRYRRKIECLRIYKCINKKKKLNEETTQGHISSLIVEYEALRKTCNFYFDRLEEDHKYFTIKIFNELRDKIVRIFGRYQIKILVPSDISEKLNTTHSIESDTETDDESEEEEPKMAAQAKEFISLATKILPDYDGKPENLQGFIDALIILNINIGDHQALAIEIIKTKLKNNTRRYITEEDTIALVIAALKEKTKGESPKSIIKKLKSIKRNDRPICSYTQEIKELTEALSDAYLRERIPADVAEGISTEHAIETIIANTNSERVRMALATGYIGTAEKLVEK